MENEPKRFDLQKRVFVISGICRFDNKANLQKIGGESLHNVEGVYSTLHHYNPNFEHLESSVVDAAMVDVPGVYTHTLYGDIRMNAG